MAATVAYTSDLILGSSGELLGREEQREAILAHAGSRQIEILEWFEDATYEERIRSRPGIMRMLEFSHRFDHLLVERFWALSPLWRELEGFLEECQERGIRVESVNQLQDGVSKLAQRFSTGD